MVCTHLSIMDYSADRFHLAGIVARLMELARGRGARRSRANVRWECRGWPWMAGSCPAVTGFMNATAKTATSSFALRSRLVESIGHPPGYSRTGLLRELSEEELTRAIIILDEWVAANLLQAAGTDAPGPRMEALIVAADRWALRNSWGSPNWSAALCGRLEHWRRICRRLPARTSR
jgi:hypothetical protein